MLEGKVEWQFGNWRSYINEGMQFICNVIQKGSNNVKKTNAGALWWDPFNNLQYTTSALFLVVSFSDSLTNAFSTLGCPGGSLYPIDLISFARSQACALFLTCSAYCYFIIMHEYIEGYWFLILERLGGWGLIRWITYWGRTPGGWVTWWGMVRIFRSRSITEEHPFRPSMSTRKRWHASKVSMNGTTVRERIRMLWRAPLLVARIRVITMSTPGLISSRLKLPLSTAHPSLGFWPASPHLFNFLITPSDPFHPNTITN